ncbi:MAG: hypothetical protein R3C05_17335 [Pirellulaceae bacterium]
MLSSICTVLLSSCLFGQAPPYDNAPDARPPYYRVRYEASEKPGELIFPVAYTLWVPDGLTKAKGVIVHQHGCGEGSCKSGQTGAFDLHWQALAAKHDCVLLSPAYEQPQDADCQMWCDPRNGSDAAFRKALSELGQLCGHPELNTVPWALWGHSGGGHWAGGMLLLHPQRVIAAWLRSGVPLFEAVEKRNIRPHELNPAATKVPVMCNLGTKEGFSNPEGRFAGVWPANKTFFEKLRGAGGIVGIAIDPLTSHECGNQRYLAIPWLDACLTARLPIDSDNTLRPMPMEQSWLATMPIPNEPIVPATAASHYSADKEHSIWLPNERVASLWLQYVTDTRVPDLTPPPKPTNLRFEGNSLRWDAAADLESGIAHFIVYRRGHNFVVVGGKQKNPFGRPLFQGLQYSDTPAMPLEEMRYEIASPNRGEIEDYDVVSVNTAGIPSNDIESLKRHAVDQ